MTALARTITGLANRNFTKRYADGAQKKGGRLYRLMQLRLPYVTVRRIVRKGKSHVGPRPSEHAVMRRKGLHGPASRTKARARWLKAEKNGRAQGVRA